MGRICAIGLDAASIELVDTMCAGGALPNLAALRSESARYRLRSGTAPRHGVLWSQFVHDAPFAVNRRGFRCSFDPETYEAYEEAAHHELAGHAPFWEAVGRDTITFDVPRSTVDGAGVHVTGWGAHAPSYARASRPHGLLREIDHRFGPHPAFENEYACGWHDRGRLERLTRALEIGAVRRAEICTFLMERFPEWQLFVTVMSEAHSASEMMWHGVDGTHPLAGGAGGAEDRLHRVYRAMDAAIGTFRRALRGDDTLLVFSLDDMESSHGDLPSIVLLPELLHRAEFGLPILRDHDVESWRRAGCPPVRPARGELWRHHIDRSLVAPPPVGPWRRLQRTPAYTQVRNSRVGRLAVSRAKHARLGALGVPIPPESDDSTVELEHRRQCLDEILFTCNYRPYRHQMRTFALPSFGEGYVRLNLRGRERYGRVAPAEYDAERRRVEALLAGCRDVRTGTPAVAAIEWFDAQSALDPDHRPYADGVISWTGPIDAFDHPVIGTIGPFAFHRTGVHRDGGFLWSSGPARRGSRGDLSVLDVPGLILNASVR